MPDGDEIQGQPRGKSATCAAFQSMAASQQSLPPRTTVQQDMTLAGQRRINLIWEYTQAVIALVVVMAMIGVCVVVAVAGRLETSVPASLAAAFGMVTGFYFGRTNHASIGGGGPSRRISHTRGDEQARGDVRNPVKSRRPVTWPDRIFAFRGNP